MSIAIRTSRTVALDVIPEVKEQERLCLGGVLYSPGITLDHLKRNDKEMDLFIALEELIVAMNDSLPLEARLSDKKVIKKTKEIYYELIARHFNDEITKFNYRNSPKVLEILK